MTTARCSWKQDKQEHRDGHFTAVLPCRVLLLLLQPCGSIEEAAALVTMAKASRAVGETRANARSSRSHLIVRIKVEVLQLSNLTALSPSPTAGSSPRRISLAASKSMKAPPATVTFSMVREADALQEIQNPTLMLAAML